MGAPQIILIVLMAMGFVIALEDHGKIGRSSVWMKLLDAAIILPLLLWGGFFSGK